VAPRWLGFVRDVERRRAWGDRLVDALCDPPESFVLGSVLAHVLTYSAQRRGLARALLRQAGVAVGEPARPGGPPDPARDGDPIGWLRRREAGNPSAVYAWGSYDSRGLDCAKFSAP